MLVAGLHAWGQSIPTSFVGLLGDGLLYSDVFQSLIFSGHLILGIQCRHLLTKVYNLLLVVFIVHHASGPHKRNNLTFILKVLILLWMESAIELHTGHAVFKACHALFMFDIQFSSHYIHNDEAYTTLPDSGMSWSPNLTEVCCMFLV